MSEPRSDTAAERLLIGAVLAGQKPDPLVRAVAPSDFYQPRHEAIWRAISRVTEAGNEVDVASVRLALDHDGASIDPLYLTELYGEAPLSGDGAFHARRIRDEARMRRLVAAGQRIAQAGEARNLDPAEAHEVARRELADALADQDTSRLTWLRDVLPDVVEIAEKGVSPALATPWPDLDRLIGGMAPGRLVIVGARPGVGKSIMGHNLALHMAEAHAHAALVVSVEMPRIEVVQRMVSCRSRVNLGDLISGSLSERQWDAISSHHEVVDALPIVIDDDAEPTVAAIRSRASEVRAERPDLALIVVDYLQLLRTPRTSRSQTRAELLGEVSRGLKVLARESNACVVAMAQVNREGAKNGAAPTMADLRESGSIEADADQVILLHRPDPDIPELDVLVDKNRWGPVGRATLQVQGHYARLTSVQWTPSGVVAQ